jgi:hypothetical protein
VTGGPGERSFLDDAGIGQLDRRTEGEMGRHRIGRGRARRGKRDRDGALGRLVLGSYLILIGVLVFAANVGFDLPRGVWSYWPFLLIAGGGVKMFFGRGRAFGEGVWLLLAGLYCWVSVWNLWGLNWGTAWPIFLIAGGLSMVLAPWFRRPGDGGDGRGTDADEGGSEPVGSPPRSEVDHVG